MKHKEINEAAGAIGKSFRNLVSLNTWKRTQKELYDERKVFSDKLHGCSGSDEDIQQIWKSFLKYQEEYFLQQQSLMRIGIKQTEDKLAALITKVEKDGQLSSSLGQGEVSVNAIRDLIEDMKTDGIKTNDPTYSRLFGYYAEISGLQSYLEDVNRMSEEKKKAHDRLCEHAKRKPSKENITRLIEKSLRSAEMGLRENSEKSQEAEAKFLQDLAMLSNQEAIAFINAKHFQEAIVFFPESLRSSIKEGLKRICLPVQDLPSQSSDLPSQGSDKSWVEVKGYEPAAVGTEHEEKSWVDVIAGEVTTTKGLNPGV